MKKTLGILLCIMVLFSNVSSFAETEEYADPGLYDITVERYIENLKSYYGDTPPEFVNSDSEALLYRFGNRRFVVMFEGEKVDVAAVSIYLEDFDGTEEDSVSDAFNMYCALYMLSPDLVKPDFEETAGKLKEAITNRDYARQLFFDTVFELAFYDDEMILALYKNESSESDLSGMTFNELVALKDKINLAIWQSAEWQEVEVPQGVWVVGEDIPAGKWTIKPQDEHSVFVYWGDKLNEAGTNVAYSTIYEYEVLTSKNNKYYSEAYDLTEVSWDLKDGHYIVVDDGIAVFTPYSGKPSLRFK